MKVAYLNTQYPSLSHTFVEREVRAVRAAGIEVCTFSIRRPNAAQTLGRNEQQAIAQTTYLLDGPRGLLWDQIAGLLRRPLGWLRATWKSQRLSPGGLKARLRHLAYVAEAVRLARRMRAEGLRHVHVHMANNGAMVALLATTYDPSLSYSLSIHGSAEFFDVHNLALRDKAERALFVRCISHFCRAQVMAWSHPSAWPHLHVVHCGVSPDDFAPTPWRTDGPLRLLAVGRMAPIKGYHLLLRACARLKAEGIDWHLDMVGDGPLLGGLKALATQLGIADRVVFSGPVAADAIHPHFDEADVLVVSSFMEGVPVVLMEAMSKELAVVATQVAGVPELVEHGVSGWLVPPGSVEALVEALLRAARQRSDLPVMGREGRRRVEEQFTIEESGRQMVSLFRQYLPYLRDVPAGSRLTAGQNASPAGTPGAA